MSASADGADALALGLVFIRAPNDRSQNRHQLPGFLNSGTTLFEPVSCVALMTRSQK